VGALLAALSLACGGDGGDPETTARPSADAAEARAVARPADALGADDPDTTAPVLTDVRLQPDPPTSGEMVRAVARVEEGEGGYALHYVWEIAGRKVEDETGAMALPRLGKGDRVAVTVTARNAAGTSDAVTAETEIENGTPSVLDLRVEEKFDTEGGLEGWEAHAWARDPDNDRVELEWAWLLNGRPTDVETSLYPTEALKRGDELRVRVRASDGDDASDWAESGTLEVGNTAPEITSLPPRVGDDGRFDYQIEVTDADGDRRFSYELVEGPRGMRMDRFRGRLSWQPDKSQAGKHRIEVAVEDRSGGRSTQEFLIPVRVGSVSLAADSEAPPANTP
jgi:hypothetical protein